MALLDYFLHIDKYIEIIIENYPILTYLFLFAVIFIETGVVILPFLPGDSFLFAAGAIIAKTGAINPLLTLILLYLAAILGDSTNYSIGRFLGEKIRQKKKIRFIKMEYIDKTHTFFKKHGESAITIARFVPIIRTFAPFVAGISEMNYKTFLLYNVIGGVLWISLMYGLGFFFGNIYFVKENFSMIIIAIVVISIIPIILTFINSKIKKY